MFVQKLKSFIGACVVAMSLSLVTAFSTACGMQWLSGAFSSFSRLGTPLFEPEQIAGAWLVALVILPLLYGSMRYLLWRPAMRRSQKVIITLGIMVLAAKLAVMAGSFWGNSICGAMQVLFE